MPPSKARRRNISQQSEMIYDGHNFGIILDSREIFIAPSIYGDEIDASVANRFITNLQLLNNLNNSTILVHQTTNGGDWNYGIAIYDAIKASCDDPSKSNIVLLAYAHARSMSSIIPQAAKWRVIMPNADFLIHFGTLGYDGDCQSGIAEAEWSKKLNERMLEIYATRCIEGQFFRREGMEEKDIIEWLRKTINEKREFYITPRQAVDYGLMDAVFGDIEFSTFEELRQEEEEE